jgi:maltoporin
VARRPWRLPASSLNGDAHVGRLGNEKDNYVELSLGKKMTLMMAHGRILKP